MNDDEATIRDLLAWAKKQPKGPVRSMANVLARQLSAQRDLPESEIVRHVIRKTIEHLKSKIDEAKACP